MKSIVFAVSYGRGMGTGNLQRNTTLALAAKKMGYQTVLIAQKASDESLPTTTMERIQKSFDEWVVPANEFVTSQELSHLKAVTAVIIDDFRNPGGRSEFIASLKNLGGTLAMVDGVPGLEFGQADKIICIEHGLSEEVKKWPGKLIHGAEYTLVGKDFFDKQPLPESLPSGKSCFFYFGSTDPLNVATQAIDAVRGLNYVPVLLASKKSPYASKIFQALEKFPRYVWFDSNLTRGQLNTLYEKVSMAVMGPASNAVYYALHNRCPIVPLPTNPTLLTNTRALKEMGLPVVMLSQNKVAQNFGADHEVLFPEIKTQLPQALKVLELAGYIDNRLPNRPPFNVTLTTQGPENILKALGLKSFEPVKA